MLWGYSVDSWDRWCVIGIWVAAIAGAIAVLAGLFTGYVGHQLSVISEREASAKIATANAQGAEAQRLAAASNERAQLAELKLEQLRRDVGPRQLNRAAFMDALVGQPREPVEIVYLRDDPECFGLAQQLRGALQDAGWTVVNLAPIAERVGADPNLPRAMNVDGQPSGVVVVSHSISVNEANALEHQMFGEEWEHTPLTVLMHAIGQGIGKVGGHAGGPNAPPDGLLRLVVAPR